MASVSERLERALERETPEWGIQPAPDGLKRFGGWDLAVLWGDLSIGLLVLVSGALLVPALGLPSALAAIAIGCVPLALVGVAGAPRGRAGHGAVPPGARAPRFVPPVGGEPRAAGRL